ncbi:ribosome biogenesis regulatory protein homolog [Bacillus rossius redtenbacheri]|uniref:ribosome biogenesis regulatory protein homolog n=1 Tax=Bacillus rossius redtenbacheri TaxID=93214 RepID=UPI002FDF0158
MDIVSEILSKAADNEAETLKSIRVDKHLDLEYDLGSLLALDPNDLDLKALRSGSGTDEYLRGLARDNTQLLLNQIWELPSERVDEAIVVRLPPPTTVLPRENPVPKPRPPTKWQRFAREKGIQKKKRANLTWDDALKKWVPNHGYQRALADKQKNWVMEVPPSSDPLQDQFTVRADKKKERVAKNEFQRLRNLAAAKNIKVPRVGVPPAESLSSTQLGKQLTVARVSTASLGKFQDKLPKEKVAKNVGALLPTTKKRKLPHSNPVEERKANLGILDGILNKKPKLDIEKAVNREIYKEQQERAEEKRSQKPKKGRGKQRGGVKKGKGAGKRPKTKPPGGKGQRHKPGQRSGRKRR